MSFPTLSSSSSAPSISFGPASSTKTNYREKEESNHTAAVKTRLKSLVYSIEVPNELAFQTNFKSEFEARKKLLFEKIDDILSYQDKIAVSHIKIKVAELQAFVQQHHSTQIQPSSSSSSFYSASGLIILGQKKGQRMNISLNMKFTPFISLVKLEQGKILNVIGILKWVGKAFKCSSGETLRFVKLMDTSESLITIRLWKKDAEIFQADPNDKHQVIAAINFKLQKTAGCVLDPTRNFTIINNPDLTAANHLRKWSMDNRKLSNCKNKPKYEHFDAKKMKDIRDINLKHQKLNKNDNESSRLINWLTPKLQTCSTDHIKPQELNSLPMKKKEDYMQILQPKDAGPVGPTCAGNPFYQKLVDSNNNGYQLMWPKVYETPKETKSRLRKQICINESRSLTAEELLGKERMSNDCFLDWNQSECESFTAASMEFGRDAYDKIGAAIGTKSSKQVAGYSQYYWKNYHLKNYVQTKQCIVEADQSCQEKLQDSDGKNLLSRSSKETTALFNCDENQILDNPSLAQEVGIKRSSPGDCLERTKKLKDMSFLY